MYISAAFVSCVIGNCNKDFPANTIKPTRLTSKVWTRFLINSLAADSLVGFISALNMLLLTSNANIKSMSVFLDSAGIIFRGFAAEIIKRASAISNNIGFMINNLNENYLMNWAINKTFPNLV